MDGNQNHANGNQQLDDGILDTHDSSNSTRPQHKHRRNDSCASQSSRRWTNIPDTALESRKVLITENMRAEVRRGLTVEENKEVDEVMLNQFLRATKHDVPKAVKRLKDTVAWRLKELPHTKLCQKCLAKPRSHYLHLVGYSRKDQPILYSCFAMAKDREVAPNKEHMLVAFEQAIRAMPAHVEQWIWLCDYHGFGLRDCDPRLTKIFLDVSERHYPERLAEFINVSTPSVFSMLWRAIEGWVDPVTRAKVKFIGFDGNADSKKNAAFRAELDRLCDPETQEWLLAEMIQNRQKHAVKAKVYPYASVHAPEGGPQAVSFDGHDCRGPPNWIETVQERTDILLPAHRE